MPFYKTTTLMCNTCKIIFYTHLEEFLLDPSLVNKELIFSYSNALGMNPTLAIYNLFSLIQEISLYLQNLLL